LPQVLKAAPDVSTQYMPIMNCIFAAQKSVRVVDILCLTYGSQKMCGPQYKRSKIPILNPKELHCK